MTQQYLIGQLSVLLEQLEVRSADGAVVHELRHRLERAPVHQVPELTQAAFELADSSCWVSLERGDVAGFLTCAETAAALGEFAECAWSDRA